VKTRDFSVADGYGVHEYPALVYFEGGIPNVFEGKEAPESILGICIDRIKIISSR